MRVAELEEAPFIGQGSTFSSGSPFDVLTAHHDALQLGGGGECQLCKRKVCAMQLRCVLQAPAEFVAQRRPLSWTLVFLAAREQGLQFTCWFHGGAQTAQHHKLSMHTHTPTPTPPPPPPLSSRMPNWLNRQVDPLVYLERERSGWKGSLPRDFNRALGCACIHMCWAVETLTPFDKCCTHVSRMQRSWSWMSCL